MSAEAKGARRDMASQSYAPGSEEDEGSGSGCGSEESAFLNSFSGAVVGAGAAADANIGIDDVLVFALGNSLNGAVIGASTALDASIGNIVSHDFPSIYMF